MATGDDTKLPLTSCDVHEQRLAQLRELFPEAFSEGKTDLIRLTQLLGDAATDAPERYGLSWVGKSEAIRTIQITSPGTLLPARGESVNFDATENLIIEGDNLEVLKLLQGGCHGRVKLICIDPPYNTGGEFIYPDNYREGLADYLRFSGQVNGEGIRLTTNAETDGRYHSKWLTMMYPRLFLARNLLREDGVIFVNIDDHEVHNLRAVMNEIFGEENFVSQIAVQNNPRGRQSDTFVATVHDYILIYAKNVERCMLNGSALSEDQRAEFNLKDEEDRQYRLLGLRQRGSASRREDRPEMFYPIYVDPKTLRVSLEKRNDTVEVLPRKSTGQEGRWMWGKERAKRNLALLEARLIERRDEFDIFVRDYLERDGEERERKFKTIWDDKAFNTQSGTQEVKALIESEAMQFPKPTALIRTVVSMGAETNGLVLDFFAGSGTTAQAVLELNAQDGGNRKFILVQLPEPTNRKDFPTIADITKERVRRVIKKMSEDTAAKERKEREEGEGQLALGAAEGGGGGAQGTDAPQAKPDLGFKVFKLSSSNFKVWDAASTPKDGPGLAEQLKLMAHNVEEGRPDEALLYELVLKSNLPLASKIQSGKIGAQTFYDVADGTLAICLERPIQQEALRGLVARKPKGVVCLDIAFAGNDQLKANTVLEMKSHGIEFHTA